MIKRNGLAFFQRIPHRCRVVRLDADDSNVRAQRLDACCDSRYQATAADGYENHIDRILGLLQDFQADRSLAGDDQWIVKSVHESQRLLPFQHACMRVGIVVGISVQHNFAAEFSHCLDLDRWRCDRHDDDSPRAALSCRQRNTLRVIAG